MFKKLSQYINYRRTVRELNALDSIQLLDVGIYRGDIKAIARARSI